MSKFATVAKRFLFSNRFGVLSTLSASLEGAPFGSIVPYDIHKSCEVIIYISLIAEHYKNLQFDNRASLLVSDPFGIHDPQAHARATSLIRFEEVAPEASSAIALSFQERFPGSINHEIAHNFRFMRGVVEKVRWIGGFGDIGWVSHEDFMRAPLDSIAYHAPDIIEHMNRDHLENLREIVRGTTKGDSSKNNLRMTAISASDIEIQVGEGGKRFTIPLPSTVNSPDEARSAIIALLKNIRNEAPC